MSYCFKCPKCQGILIYKEDIKGIKKEPQGEKCKHCQKIVKLDPWKSEDCYNYCETHKKAGNKCAAERTEWTHPPQYICPHCQKLHICEDCEKDCEKIDQRGGTYSFARCEHCNKKFSGDKSIKELNDHYCPILKGTYKDKKDLEGGGSNPPPIQENQTKNPPTHLLIIGGICLVIGLIGLIWQLTKKTSYNDSN
jgi:hypothetical protein